VKIADQARKQNDRGGSGIHQSLDK
jgi:hypothetical protein